MGILRAALVIDTVLKGRRAFKEADTLIGGFGRSLRAIGPGSFAIGIDAIGRAMTGAVRGFVDFERSIVRVAALSPDARDRLDELKEVARRVGRETIFSASDVAEGMVFLAQAGLDVTEIINSISGVADLATISFTDMAEATRIAVAVANVSGLGLEKLDRVIDVLAFTTANSVTNLSELGTAFSRVGPLAKGLGVDFEEVAAAIAALSNAGLAGEEAGTRVRNFLVRLINPTGAAAKIIEDLGIQIFDANNQFLGMVPIINQFSEALAAGNLTAAQIQEIFGIRATDAAIEFITTFAEGTDTIEDFSRALREDAAGSAEDMVGFIETSAFFAFEKFQNLIEDLAINIGEVLAPSLILITEIFEDQEENLNALGDGIAGAVAKMIEVFVDHGDILERLIGIFGNFTPLLEKIVPIIDLVVTGVESLIDFIASLGLNLNVVAIAILAFVAPTLTAITALLALIGLAKEQGGALGDAFILIRDNLKEVVTTFTENNTIMDGFKSIIKNLLPVLLAVAVVISQVLVVAAKVLASVMEFLMPILVGVSFVIGKLAQGIIFLADKINPFLPLISNFIKIFLVVAAVVGAVVGGPITLAIGIFIALAAAIAAVVKNFDSLKDKITDNKVVDFFKSVVGGIKSFAGSSLDAVANVAPRAAIGLKSKGGLVFTEPGEIIFDPRQAQTPETFGFEGGVGSGPTGGVNVVINISVDRTDAAIEQLKRQLPRAIEDAVNTQVRR